MGLGFCQTFFCIYWDDRVIFALHSTDMVEHTDWHSYIESIWLSWGKSRNILALISCCTLLVFCWGFYVYIHKSVVSFSCNIFVWIILSSYNSCEVLSPLWLFVWEVLVFSQFSSVTHSCLTLCDPMDCSTLGLPVHHQLPELAQTHVHRVGDAIQPSHPLSSLSLPTINLSQHQGLFQGVSSLHQVAKVLEFQLQHQSFQWIFRTDFFLDWLVESSCSPRDSRVFSNTTVQKHQLLGTQLSL